MDLIELGSALSAFFDQGLSSPSHDEITQAFRRAQVAKWDPRQSPTDPVGKTKRVRQVFIEIHDNEPGAGLQLARHLVSLLRSDGAFDAKSERFAGQEKTESLRRALADFGLDLDPTGRLRPIVIDNLHGSDLTKALRSYVNRANLNPEDSSLQVGNGKELDETAARHILEEIQGSYSPSTNFPTTLANAFIALNLSPADPKLGQTLDRDPHRAVQQCLYQLGCAVNRLRNEVGTGHGHPSPSRKTNPLTPAEARLVARASALVAGMLLDSLP